MEIKISINLENTNSNKEINNQVQNSSSKNDMEEDNFAERIFSTPELIVYTSFGLSFIIIIFFFIKDYNQELWMDFLKSYCEANITIALAFAALIAGMAGFRWPHIQSAYNHVLGGEENKKERRETIKRKAKTPLYYSICSLTFFVLLNIILTGVTYFIKYSETATILSFALVFMCFISTLLTIYLSIRYIRYLIYK